jgi:hypothetical protein
MRYTWSYPAMPPTSPSGHDERAVRPEGDPTLVARYVNLPLRDLLARSRTSWREATTS